MSTSGVTLCAKEGTRLHKLLNSNEVPNDSDLDFVKSDISDIDARLAVLNTEIALLRDRLKQLEGERSTLSGRRTQNIGVSSPLRRMPPEVLSEIFLCTLPLSTTVRPRFHLTDSPWVLTHVSRYWRSVCISTPALWSLVCISYQPGFRPSSSFPIGMVETQVARAGRLKIHFYGDERMNPQPQIDVFKCLATHSSRWEELCITLTSVLAPLLAGIRDRVPLLRRIAIEWHIPVSQARIDTIDCFWAAPSLVDVSIYNEFRFIPFTFPIHNLVRYDLDAPWTIHHGILRLASNLVEARIIVEFNSEPWPSPEEAITLSLVRLCVSRPEILNYITTPRLEEISIHNPKSRSHDAPYGAYLATYLQSFVTRSSCPLRRLCLIEDPTPIPEILNKILSIVELLVDIRDPSMTSSISVNALILRLTVTNPADSIVAPQLRSILFGCLDDGNIKHPLYLEMNLGGTMARDLIGAVLWTCSDKKDWIFSFLRDKKRWFRCMLGDVFQRGADPAALLVVLQGIYILGPLF
ncbi:F-box domain-containing protein [Mycena venus]|uniref:F-box domain-containing protein n=1 Tax=Mycena venus TaxID=2733690 RepID=A0A8H6XRL0_9AGAR|nr:F-box domain-containing protein [Mycena venus]